MESHIIKLPAQPLNTFLPNESDRSDRQTQFRRHLRVWTGRRFKKQQFDQSLALRRKRPHGIAEHLFFLCLLNQAFRNGRSLQNSEILGVAADHPRLLLFPSVTLMVRHLYQPLRKRAWLAQLRQASEQFDAGGLKYLRGFMCWKTVFDGNGIN